MARTPTNPDAPKKKRAPSKPKQAFMVLQVVDADGNAMKFDKSQIKILTVTTDTVAMLDLLEGNAHEGAFYLRVTLPQKKASGGETAVTATVA